MDNAPGIGDGQIKILIALAHNPSNIQVILNKNHY
jgi:hypothetical protein